MLLGGGGNCQGCGCKSCQDCTRTCTDPHTGDAFEVVYSYKFEGAEAGNTTDGYLTAEGDSDASDPYDGMDGTSPWQQKITGSFSLNNTQTRYPCWVRVSFWRSNFVLGAATIPPPSTALTVEEIKITNSAGSQGSVVLDDYETVLAPGESYTYTSVPLVSGSGDQSGNDPRFSQGTHAFRQACANESVTVDVTATIAWTTQKRQHILYGIVRECYETGSPCASKCSGSAAPDVVYMTVSNLSFSLSAGSSLPSWWSGATSGLAGTYALERVPFQCDYYEFLIEPECSGFYSSTLWGFPRYAVLAFTSGFTSQFDYSSDVVLQTTDGQKCESVILQIPGNSIGDNDNCSLPKSGSNGSIYRTVRPPETGAPEKVGSFSWSIDD